MDRLEPEDKRALQAASQIGQHLNADVLRDLLATEDYDCRELVEHDLVRPEGGWWFLVYTRAHSGEGVYGSLIKSQRRALHRKGTQWFADSDLVLHAEHLAQAGDESAPQAFLEAAHEQAGQYRLEKALALVERGLGVTTNRRASRFSVCKAKFSAVLGQSKNP